MKVLLFSILKERVGSREISIDVSQETTVRELLSDICEESPAIAEFLPAIRVAVNQAYVPSDAIVRPGDEVALITPVSGG